MNLYFNKQKITGDKFENEKTIRKIILKRHMIIDFQNSEFDEYKGNENSKFIGVENTGVIQVLRIRGRLFKVFPKVVVNLDIKNGLESLKYRLSFISTIVMIFLACVLIMGIISYFTSQVFPLDLEVFLGAFVIYSICIYVEFYFTKIELKTHLSFNRES